MNSNYNTNPKVGDLYQLLEDSCDKVVGIFILLKECDVQTLHQYDGVEIEGLWLTGRNKGTKCSVFSPAVTPSPRCFLISRAER